MVNSPAHISELTEIAGSADESNAGNDIDTPISVTSKNKDKTDAGDGVASPILASSTEITNQQIGPISQDDDQWQLRKRVLEFITPLHPEAAQDSAQARPARELDPVASSRLDRLFRPKSNQNQEPQFTRGEDEAPQDEIPNNQGDDQTRDGITNQPSNKTEELWRSSSALPLGSFQKPTFHSAFVTLKAEARKAFAVHTRDIVVLSISSLAFVIPISLLSYLTIDTSPLELSFILVLVSFAVGALLGAQAGAISMLTTYTWIAFFVLPPDKDLATADYVARWIAHILIVSGVVPMAFGVGYFSTLFRDQLRLGRAGVAREADITNLQKRLQHARNVETILAYLVTYCKETLSRKCFFLALDDAEIESNPPLDFDIAQQLREMNYARISVDRKSYVPRILKSFKASGLAAYPLETPSGLVGILGLDITRNRKLPVLEDRYLRLILTTSAYAIERLKLKEQLTLIEDMREDDFERQKSLKSVMSNISNSIDAIESHIYDLHTLMHETPDHPHAGKVNMIERQLGALRNSISILRDVLRQR